MLHGLFLCCTIRTEFRRNSENIGISGNFLRNTFLVGVRICLSVCPCAPEFASKFRLCTFGTLWLHRWIYTPASQLYANTETKYISFYFILSHTDKTMSLFIIFINQVKFRWFVERSFFCSPADNTRHKTHTFLIWAKNEADGDDGINTGLIEVIAPISCRTEESLLSGASNKVGCSLIVLIDQKLRSIWIGLILIMATWCCILIRKNWIGLE